MQPKSAADSGSAPWSPSRLIDLERYPILDLNGETARALTAHCREQLDRTGACELPGFLTREAVEILVRRDRESAVLTTKVLVLPAAPRLSTIWPFLAAPPFAIALFALHETLRRSRLR